MKIDMKNDEESSFPELLLNGLWHCTSLERFNKILQTGSIECEPSIPDSDRFCSTTDPIYPFVRSLGGVSLFDFREFSPQAYSKKYPVSSWWTFAPNCERFETTVWIRIDAIKVSDRLVTGRDLLKCWKTLKQYRRSIMPIIECAYIGDLNISCFTSAYRFDVCSNAFIKIEHQRNNP